MGPPPPLKGFLLAALAGLALLAAPAAGQCSNACSGHGLCGVNSVCTCFTGYAGGDCSQRTCPPGRAWVTTPQGDLNLDGDQYDNSLKLIVKGGDGKANTGTILETDDMLTFGVDLAAGEFQAGDALVLGEDREQFTVSSVVSNRVLELDHDRYTGIPVAGEGSNKGNVYRFLEDIRNPTGTWESWVGDFHQSEDEGHYYMECSNRGHCNPATGACECYPGYSGSACQRMTCPNDCSGQGTCEDIPSFTRMSPAKLSFTVEGTATSLALTPSADPMAAGIQRGDFIKVGASSQFVRPVEVTSVTSAAITIARALPEDVPFGTLAYHLPKYALWDHTMSTACYCDPGFTGSDCSKRICPKGDDPYTTTVSPASAADEGITYKQRNERQTIIIDTMRGQVGGSFRLTFTDTFGQEWTTDPVDVNERLQMADGKTPVRAYVAGAAPGMDYVTFAPALPYGELEAGDFVILGDERKEVTTVFPEPVDPDGLTNLMRPVKSGGVVDSIRVREAFQARSSAVPLFRAGPAKGIKKALERMGAGNWKVIPAVTTTPLFDGTLIGYASGGATTATAQPPDTQQPRPKVTTLSTIKGDFDPTMDAASSGAQLAVPDTGGGLAPYDLVRVTGKEGQSEFLQLVNVDHAANHGSISGASAIGSLGVNQAGAANLGLAAGRYGAIYRAGGYTTKVAFDANPGNLPEMECDDHGLFNMFYREFAGTVTAEQPSYVQVRFHGNLQVSDAARSWPVPHNEEKAMFKGDLAHLKVMAGIRVAIENQVRTVVTDVATDAATGESGFYVDLPFDGGSQSETIDGVDYVFYRFPVQQLYDQTTYNMVTIPEIYEVAYNSPSVTYAANTITLGSAGTWHNQFAAGDTITISGSANQENNVRRLTIKSISSTVITVAETLALRPAAVEANAIVIRKYDSLGMLSNTANYAPPLHRNNRALWCKVTDQRPIRWIAPDVSGESQSAIEYSSNTQEARRWLVSAGSGAVTVDTALNTIQVTASTRTFALTSTPTPALNSVFGAVGTILITQEAYADATSKMDITSTRGNTGVCVSSSVTATTIVCSSFTPATSDSIQNDGPAARGTVRFSTYHGGLIDNRLVEIGDRVTVKRDVGDFESRQVDNVFGANLDVTAISVSYAFTDSPSAFLHEDKYAWVDDSGTTESLECSRRGLCNEDSGVCDCFSGFAGPGCTIIDALSS